MSAKITRVFPYDPNGDVRERLAYSTSIHVAESGMEQRAARRSKPFRSLSWPVVLIGLAEVNEARALLWNAHADRWVVPFWPDMTPLTATASQNDTMFTVTSTATRDFAVGRPAVLWRNPRSYQYIIVASITSTAVFAPTTPALRAWPPADTVLVPAAYGSINQVSLADLGLKAGSFDASFELEAF